MAVLPLKDVGWDRRITRPCETCIRGAPQPRGTTVRRPIENGCGRVRSLVCVCLVASGSSGLVETSPDSTDSSGHVRARPSRPSRPSRPASSGLVRPRPACPARPARPATPGSSGLSGLVRLSRLAHAQLTPGLPAHPAHLAHPTHYLSPRCMLSFVVYVTTTRDFRVTFCTQRFLTLRGTYIPHTSRRDSRKNN